MSIFWLKTLIRMARILGPLLFEGAITFAADMHPAHRRSITFSISSLLPTSSKKNYGSVQQRHSNAGFFLRRLIYEEKSQQ